MCVCVCVCVCVCLRLCVYMQSAKNQQLAATLVDPSYVAQGADAWKSFDNLVTVLLSQRNLPMRGGAMEILSACCSSCEGLEQFSRSSEVGEREARVFSSCTEGILVWAMELAGQGTLPQFSQRLPEAL